MVDISKITLPDNSEYNLKDSRVPANAVFTDTTYSFASGTNGFTVTPSGGSAQTVTVAPSNSWEINFNGSNTASVAGQDIQDMRSAYAGGSEVYVRATNVTISNKDITNMNFDFHMTTVGATGTFALVGTAIDSDFADIVIFLSLTITPNVLATAAGSAEISVIGDSNTTYTFTDGTNGFTVTPSNGTAQTVNVTPNIANASYNNDGLITATNFKQAFNYTNSGALDTSKANYVYCIDSNGSPAFRSHAVAYNHYGLMTNSMYNQLFNHSSTDGSRDTSLAGKIWKCGSDGAPAWRNDDDTWKVNTVTQDGYVPAPTNSKGYYFYCTNANGSPSWSDSVTATYNHSGLFTASQYRQLFNYNSDGTRANLARKFWACTKAGNAGWYDYTATTTDPGWMSAEDKIKLDAIGTKVENTTLLATSCSNSWTDLVSGSLTAGTWIVMACVTFAGNGQTLTLRSNTHQSMRNSVYANGTANFNPFIADLITLTSTTTVAFAGYATGSVTISNGNFRAIRIA